MKTICKRVLPILLVLVLVLGLIPSVSASTDDGTAPVTAPAAAETSAADQTTPADTSPPETEETEPETIPDEDAEEDSIQMMDAGDYAVMAAASTSSGILLFDFTDNGNYTTVLNSQLAVTYKPNGTGSTKTAYLKNLGWHFARYNNVPYADDPLYCIEPYKSYAASTSGNSVDRGVTLDGSGSTTGSNAWYALPYARRQAIGLILLYSNRMWDHSISVTTTKKDDNPNVPLRIATQFLIYEIVCGLRDPSTFQRNSTNESGTSGDIFYNAGVSSVSNFASNYNSLVSYVQSALKIPSFTSSSSSTAPTIVLTGDETSVYDSNGVLSGFSFTDGNGAEFSKSGNTLYIYQTGTIAESTVFHATKSIPSAADSTYSLWYMTGSSYQTTINLFSPETSGLNAYFKLQAPATGDLSLTKTTEDGTNLSGWQFGIYSDSACTNLVAGPYTTNSSGKISVTGLDAGTYYVKELGNTNSSINSRYVCSSTNPQRITISSGTTTSVSFENKIATGSLAIVKSTDDGKNLSGWQFGIYSNSACTTLVSGPHTTDSGGKISVAALPIGTYYVKELGHSDKTVEAMYSCSSTNPQAVTISYGTTATVSFYNTLDPGSVKLIKQTNTGSNLGGWQIGLYTDAACTQPITGSPFTTGADGTVTVNALTPGTLYAREIAVEDAYWVCDTSVKTVSITANTTASVTFQNTHYGDLQVKKNAVNGSAAGWSFQILDENKKLVETTKTGSDGYAVSGKLLPGKYYVVEVHDRNETYWTYDTTVEKQVTVAAGKQAQVTFINEQFGVLDFVKTTNTGNQLAGWVFRVRDSDGNHIGDYTTDETGYASTGKLKPGHYTVIELATDDDYWNVELGFHSVTIVAGETFEDKWLNREQGLGWFYKSTNTGESLTGWEITIFSDKECTQKVSTITTGEDGKTGLYLDPGIYYAKETGDTEGRFENEYWLVDAAVKEFEIKPHKDTEIFFSNTQYGKIKITKAMPTGGSAKGWQFVVKDANGDEINGSPFTTDETGLIATEMILPGIYTVEERIPEGSLYFCASDNPQSVTVKQGETAAVTFTNALRPGRISIKKVDTTGKPLAGAEFLLEWSEDGENWQPVVRTESEYVKEGTCSSPGIANGKLVSGTDGMVMFTGLHPQRKYRVTETKVPDGFQLLTEAAFEGSLPLENDLCVELTVVNVREFELPETGSRSMVLMPISLALACGLCLTFLLWTKRNRR